MNSQELAYEIARVIDEKMGYDIVVADLRGMSDITEFFVIATANNNRAVDAIVDEIENHFRPMGICAFAIEGREDNTWDLMDFGSVIAHVFQPEARSFYRLEKLWADAPRAEVVDGQIVSVASSQPQEAVVPSEAELEAAEDLIED